MGLLLFCHQINTNCRPSKSSLSLLHHKQQVMGSIPGSDTNIFSWWFEPSVHKTFLQRCFGGVDSGQGKVDSSSEYDLSSVRCQEKYCRLLARKEYSSTLLNHTIEWSVRREPSSYSMVFARCRIMSDARTTSWICCNTEGVAGNKADHKLRLELAHPCHSADSIMTSEDRNN